MTHKDSDWRHIKRRAVTAVAALLLLIFAGSAPLLAQMTAMRPPSINMQSRIPSISVPHTDPSLAGRAMSGVLGSSLRSRPDCNAADRDGSGYCLDQSGVSNSGRSSKSSGRRSNVADGTINSQTIANELVLELDAALSDGEANAWALRHGLRRIDSQRFSLIGTTLGLFRLTGRKPMDTARRELAADRSVRSFQPNYRYVLQDQKVAASEGDPAQYALAKLHLPQAHALAHGANVTIAVIDSGVDLKHPEFSSAAMSSFDVLGGKEGPHPHGTGVAGAIVSHARLMGAAPAARLLAIRAFGAVGKAAESNSYTILKALDYAAAQGAQIINMSFAGPKDPLVARGLAALSAKGALMVAAAGNAGPKSPPLYPAAEVSVIAVSATDIHDKLFAASNRGSYIALAAPGADIFLPAPDGQYQITSGTSFSAAYVSGLAALMLERNPALKPEQVRAILMKTARDLGPPGRDDQFGAGEADAFAAVSAVSSAPVAETPESPAVTELSSAPPASAAPDGLPPAAAVAAERPPRAQTQPE